MSFIFSQTHLAKRSVGKFQSFASYDDTKQNSPFIGQTLSGEISEKQTLTHQFYLSKGQFFHLEFVVNGLNARIAFKENNGETVSDVFASESLTLPLIFIVKNSGTYTLTIKGEGGNEDGFYKLSVEDIRPSKPNDAVQKLAEEKFYQGNLAIQKWTFESFQNAIKYFKESALLRRSTKDKSGEIKAVLALGDTYLLTNELTRALQNYRLALTLSRENKTTRQEVASLIGLCKAHGAITDYQKEAEYCKQGVQLAKTVADKYLEAEALNGLGKAHWDLDNLTLAGEYYEKALMNWRTLKHRYGEADTLLNLSYLEFQKGEAEKSISSANKALQIFSAIKNPHGEALVLIALGHYFGRLGDKQKALDYYEQSLKLIQPMKDLKVKARGLTGIAWIYEGFGETDKAFDYNNQALRLFRQLGNRSGEVYLLMAVGGYFSGKKDYTNALTNLHLALKISRDNKYAFFESLTLQMLGYTYKMSGNKMRALEFYKLALERVKGADYYTESRILSDLGVINQELGKDHFSQAQEFYEKALEAHRKLKDISYESLTLYRFASLERERGNLDKAKTYVEASLNLSDTLRSQFTKRDFRSLYSASAHDLHELYIDVLMSLDKQRPDAGFAKAAFEASERGRARTLLEMLTESKISVRADADATLLSREQELQKQLREKAEKQIKLLSGNHKAEDANTLAKDIENTLNEYKEIQNKIRLSSPRYASLMQPRPLSLSEIQQQLLDDETQLLEFSLGAERSFLWVISKNNVESFELPKRKIIEESVKKTLTSLIKLSEQSRALRSGKNSVLAIDSSYETESLRLSKMLFDVAKTKLKGNRLLIVADGTLQNLPFGALPFPDVGSQKLSDIEPFIAKYEIVNLPSASTLALLRQEKRENQRRIDSVAIFADPVFTKDDERLQGSLIASNKSKNKRSALRRSHASTLRALSEIAHASLNNTSTRRDGFDISRLPFSRWEADAVSELLPSEKVLRALDFKANINTATSAELANYKVVHFATHGFLNGEQPELSGIVFSLFNERGEPQDGFLSLQEIYNLKFPVELVVLSACETGLGKEIKGEGIVGLTRGFMYAGAARVIASLWKVDDAATAELMKHFYGKLLKENLSPSAALRSAQMQMLKQKNFNSPYFWAAFQIQGEWK